MGFISLDQITNMVVHLRQPIVGGFKVGTGTLVTKDGRPFILTAQHVANDITSTGELVVKGPGDLPIVLPVGKVIDGHQIQWTPHPEADLAAFEIKPQDKETVTALQNRFLPLSFFSDLRASPSRDLTLTSIGFPLGLGTQGYFSPLTFESKASSGLLTLPRADTNTMQAFFALENPSVGGYSGCPIADFSVFKAGGITTTGGGSVLYGVMHGTISDSTGGKIAMVTPAFYVHELMKII